LGRIGMQVSEVAFGCCEIGIPYGLGVTSQKDMLSENEAIELLHAAVEGGINFFDTAPLYGRSEAILGKALSPIRNQVIISTKCAKNMFDNDGRLLKGRGLQKAVDSSIKASLVSLQTDYVDVFLIHQVTDEILESEEVAAVFNQLKEKGAARAIGVSTYGAVHSKKAIESGTWDVIMLAYNLMDQTHAQLLPLAEQRGVGIIVRSVFFKGILTDKGEHLHKELEAVEEHRTRYSEVLSDDVPTLSALALKFVLSHKETSSALLGIDKMEYLQEALAVADGNYFDEEMLAQLRKMAYPDPEFINLPLWDKKGWLR